MALPPTARRQRQVMDPSDQLDFYISISRGAGEYDVLQPDEQIVSFTLALPADSYAAGLRILTDQDHVPRLANLVIGYWLQIDPSMRDSALFDGGGIELAVELTFTTNFSPARTKQRSIIHGVANQ